MIKSDPRLKGVAQEGVEAWRIRSREEEVYEPS